MVRGPRIAATVLVLLVAATARATAVAGDLAHCTGFRAALNASDNPGSAIQACEKATADEKVKRPCLAKIHPDIEATVYTLRCETACADAPADSDELMACQVIKANALKGRRIFEGVPDAALAAAKARATSMTEGRPPAQFWTEYVAQLRGLDPGTPAPPTDGPSCEDLAPFVAVTKTTRFCAPATRAVHLTFDDGPSLETTPKALEVLKRNGLSGTFFVLGSLLDTKAMKPGSPAYTSAIERLRLVRRMREQGSTVASHDYVHEPHTKMDPDDIAGIALKSRDAGVGTVVDGTPMERYLEPVYRLPYGDGQLAYRENEKGTPNTAYRGDDAEYRVAKIKEAYTTGAGFRHGLYWNVDTEDWKVAGNSIGPEEFAALPASEQQKVRREQRDAILRNLMAGLCASGGGTVLFHDIHPSTVENLQAFVNAIRCAGYSFGDLDSQFSGGVRPWLNPDLQPSESCRKAPSSPLNQETVPW